MQSYVSYHYSSHYILYQVSIATYPFLLSWILTLNGPHKYATGGSLFYIKYPFSDHLFQMTFQSVKQVLLQAIHLQNSVAKCRISDEIFPNYPLYTYLFSKFPSQIRTLCVSMHGSLLEFYASCSAPVVAVQSRKKIIPSRE